MIQRKSLKLIKSRKSRKSIFIDIENIHAIKKKLTKAVNYENQKSLSLKKSLKTYSYKSYKNKKIINNNNNKENILNIEGEAKGLPTKSKNYLWICLWVAKFIANLRTKANIKKIESLKKYQEEIINDKVAFFTPEKPKIGIYKKLKHSLNNIVNKINCIPIIDPANKLKIVWDLIHFITVLVDLMLIPLLFGFHKELWNQKDFLDTRLLIPSLLFLDIIINFNTAFYRKVELITNRKSIIKNYLKNDFFSDFFALIILVITFFWKENFVKYLLLLALIQFVKLKHIIKEYDEKFLFKDNKKAFLDLAIISCTIFYFAHFIGCLWHFMADLEINTFGYTYTWLHDTNIVDASLGIKYINSLYFAIVTMVTVGYGDIGPANYIEKVFLIFSIVFSCMIYAFSIESIGEIIKQSQKGYNRYRKKLVQIDNFLVKRGINKSLASKVKKYFAYTYENSENKFSVLDTISNKLKEEIIIDMYNKIFLGSNLLSQNFSKEFLNKLALCVQEHAFAPDDLVYRANDDNDKAFYFVINGEVELFIDLNEKSQSLQSVKKGEIFGFENFLQNNLRRKNAKSKKLSSIGCISKNDFIETIKNFYDDFEKFCAIKDSFTLYHNYNQIYQKCEACKWSDHLTENCKFLSFKADKDLIIRKYIKKSKHHRRVFTRKERIKLKSLLIQAEIKEAAENFVNDLLIEEENENYAEWLVNLLKRRKANDLKIEGERLTQILQKKFRHSESPNVNNNIEEEDMEYEESFKFEEKGNTSICGNTLFSDVLSPKRKSFNVIKDSDNEEKYENENKEIKDNRTKKSIILNTENEINDNKTKKSIIFSENSSPKIIKNNNANHFSEDDFEDKFYQPLNETIKNSKKTKSEKNEKKIGISNIDFSLNFETSKNFKYYFPHNNIEYIVQRKGEKHRAANLFIDDPESALKPKKSPLIRKSELKINRVSHFFSRLFSRNPIEKVNAVEKDSAKTLNAKKMNNFEIVEKRRPSTMIPISKENINFMKYNSNKDNDKTERSSDTDNFQRFRINLNEIKEGSEEQFDEKVPNEEEMNLDEKLNKMNLFCEIKKLN